MEQSSIDPAPGPRDDENFRRALESLMFEESTGRFYSVERERALSTMSAFAQVFARAEGNTPEKPWFGIGILCGEEAATLNPGDISLARSRAILLGQISDDELGQKAQQNWIDMLERRDLALATPAERLGRLADVCVIPGCDIDPEHGFQIFEPSKLGQFLKEKQADLAGDQAFGIILADHLRREAAHAHSIKHVEVLYEHAARHAPWGATDWVIFGRLLQRSYPSLVGRVCYMNALSLEPRHKGALQALYDWYDQQEAQQEKMPQMEALLQSRLGDAWREAAVPLRHTRPSNGKWIADRLGFFNSTILAFTVAFASWTQSLTTIS